jgi:hypothetical protein
MLGRVDRGKYLDRDRDQTPDLSLNLFKVGRGAWEGAIMFIGTDFRSHSFILAKVEMIQGQFPLLVYVIPHDRISNSEFRVGASRISTTEKSANFISLSSLENNLRNWVVLGERKRVIGDIFRLNLK